MPLRRTTIALLATLAFLATLVLHAPAALVIRSGKEPGAPQWLGLQGTLSAGRVAAITIHNRTVAKDLEWTLQPLWLVLLRFSADVQAVGDSTLRAQVSRAPFGKLQLHDVDAATSARAVLAALGQQLAVQGQVRLSLPVLKLDAGLPVEAEGTVEVEGLAWALAREPLQLGDFAAEFTTDDEGVLATLTSGNGPLELGGEARLKEDRSYDVHLQLRLQPEAGQQLRALVASLGAPDTQGWYHLRRQGKLAEPPQPE